MNAALSPATDVPMDIHGLDAVRGLAYMAGKKSLYIAMLRRFAETQADCGRQIRASIESGDMEAAQRLAHTLKSVSATLGALGVQQCAALLEHSLRERCPPHEVQLRIAELEPELESLVAALHDRL